MVLFPLQTEYGEGVVLHLTDAIVRGEPIYRDPQAFPWLVSPYAPLHMWLASLLHPLFGGGYGGGRLISLLAGLGCVALVGWAAGRHWGRAAGLTAATVFAATPLFLEWSARDRVDLLALYFELAGLYWVDSTLLSPRGRRVDERVAIAVAALLFSLAFWTKQNFVMGMAAASLALGLRCWRSGVGLLVASLVAIGVPFAVMDARSGGRLAELFFRFNAVPYNTGFAWLWTVEWVKTFAVALPLGLLAFTLRWREAPAWAFYALFSVITGAGIGRIGAYCNYFLPLQAAASVGCGLGFALLSRTRVGVMVAGAALLAQCAVAFFSHLPPFDPTPQRVAILRKAVDGGAAEIIRKGQWQVHGYAELLSRYPGPLIAENMGPLVTIGRPSVLCDPITLFTLADMGLWDDALLLRGIREKRFAAILLQELTERNLRFPPRVLKLIHENYEPKWRVDSDVVLVPRP